MIKDFKSYRPNPEVMAEIELLRLPQNAEGYRLDINAPGIRDAALRYRKERGIPLGDPLSTSQRMNFERWYIRQKVEAERAGKKDA